VHTAAPTPTHPPVTPTGTRDRRRDRTLRSQFLLLGPLLFVWIATASLLWTFAVQDEVPTDRLFLDPATLSGQPWYTGLLHEVGILAWAGAAVAAAGGAWVSAQTNRRGPARLLASGAALTLVLLTDEVTSFHADLGPRIGLPKLVVIGAIAVSAAMWFAINWREIRRTRWLILVSSLAALAASIVLDYERRSVDLHVFFEDAPKLLGTVGWATYFAITTIDVTRSAVTFRPPEAANPAPVEHA
jgi:hypothetical protein